MPTYEYRCKECGNELEVVQSFTDDSLTNCDACGGPLRKVFGNVGIAFKGSGFYKNDSRGKSPSPASGASESSSGTDAGSPATPDSGAQSEPTKPTEPTKADPKADPKADKKTVTKPPKTAGAGTSS